MADASVRTQILTYKYRLKDRSAAKRLRQMTIACNQVWNYCVAHQSDVEMRYRAGAKPRKWASAYDLTSLCKGVGKDLGIHQQTVGLICQQFVISRTRAKRNVRFRSSFGSRRSLGWVPFQRQARNIEENSVIHLGKRYRWFGNKRRPLPEAAKGGAFVEDARGRWWVCFHVEVEARPTGAGAIGIDLGLKSLATCSDGSVVPALHHYRQYERQLAKAQRARNKSRVKAIHGKIANARKDHLHKASARIAKENSIIIVGNVNAAQLAKTKMAKSVLDASWSMFRNQLRYKASRHGATFLEVDEKFTSQVCSACGCLPASRPKGIADLRIRVWECSDCGAVHDRDVNAARNILRLGLSAQPLAEESQPNTG